MLRARVPTRAAAKSAELLRGKVIEALLHAALLVSSILVALGVGELAVRVLMPQQLILKRPDIWRPVDELGWVHQPNVRTTINTGERTVRFITDQDGFRIGTAGRLEGETHLLLLGDSFVEALQVEHEQSVAGLLEARLPLRMRSTVAIRNAAVGGWDPSQYLLRARSLLKCQCFDLALVFVYLGNDIIKQRQQHLLPRVPVEVHRFRVPDALALDELIDAIAYPINDLLEVRSQLFILLKNAGPGIRMRLGLSPAYFPEGLLRRESTSSMWQLTADVLSEIAMFAGARGTRTLFVLIPPNVSVDRRVFLRYVRAMKIDTGDVDLDQPSRIMRNSLRSRGAAVLDLLPLLREAYANSIRLYGSVDTHLTPEGNEIVARHIELRVAKLLSPPPRLPTEEPSTNRCREITRTRGSVRRRRHGSELQDCRRAVSIKPSAADDDVVPRRPPPREACRTTSPDCYRIF